MQANRRKKRKTCIFSYPPLGLRENAGARASAPNAALQTFPLFETFCVFGKNLAKKWTIGGHITRNTMRFISPAHGGGCVRSNLRGRRGCVNVVGQKGLFVWGKRSTTLCR
nr:MAG TPA: hypothetical protein [Caudoviricetes sp.]